MRDTEADFIGGLLTLAAAGFTGYVSHALYAAAAYLPGALYSNTFTLSAAVAIVAAGLTLRGVYLLCQFAAGVRRERITR
jgi:hypothetical protein